MVTPKKPKPQQTTQPGPSRRRLTPQRRTGLFAFSRAAAAAATLTAAVLGAATLAYAADMTATGKIKSPDMSKHQVTLEDGSTYNVAKGVSLARCLRLQAALALAKLYESNANAGEAQASKAFGRTPDVPEIAEARALLEGLAPDSIA